jgi:hypothetical protein
MQVSNLEDKKTWLKKTPNAPLMQRSLQLIYKHKCAAALFKIFKNMQKRIFISPHQRFLHLPLGPIFSPTIQG